MHRDLWVAQAILAAALLLPLGAWAGTITTTPYNDDLDLRIIDDGGLVPGINDDVPSVGGEAFEEEPTAPQENDDVVEPVNDDLPPINDDLPPINDDLLPPSAVPEPATLMMLGLGLGGLFVAGRRQG